MQRQTSATIRTATAPAPEGSMPMTTVTSLEASR